MAENREYRRSLGLLGLISLGLGGTIGSGIFVVPGVAAGIMGPASLVAWILVAISASCVMYSLIRLLDQFGAAGSFYEIFQTVFGRKTAVILVTLYSISAVFGIATIAAGIGQYVSFFGITGLLPIEIGIIATFCIINILGIALSGKTEIILTLGKMIPLIAIAIVLIPFIHPANLVPDRPFAVSGLIATIIIVYWPYTGFEISAIPIRETREPRVVARSLVIVMAIVTSVYILLNISLIGSVGSQALASSSAPVATAIATIFPYAGVLVALIGIGAMLSALNAYIIGSSRVVHTIGMQHTIPVIEQLNRLGTPAGAIVVTCGIGAVLLLFSNQFNRLASISVVTTLVPYCFFCVAAFLLTRDVSTRLISAIGGVSTAGILFLSMTILI